MSALSLNPDGKTLATTPDGHQLRVGDDCPCDCRPSGPCLWYRFDLCGGGTCLPCQPLPVAWSCWPIAPAIGTVAAINGRLPNDPCQVDACYRYNGAAPLEEAPPGSLTFGLNNAQDGLSCSDPACNPDLCGDWVLLTTCAGHNPCPFPVYADRTMIVGGCRAFGIFCDGRSVCYCPTGTSTGVLPPGAVVAGSDVQTCRGCCACKYQADRFNGIARPDCAWGNAPDMIANPQGCCCGRFLSVNATLAVDFPFGGLFDVRLANARDQGPENPNGWGVSYDVLNSGIPTWAMRVIFFCGGLVGLRALPPSPMPPVGITSLFTTISTNRTCLSMSNSSAVGSATVEAQAEASGCDICGSSSSSIRSGGCSGCGNSGPALEAFR